MQKFEGFGFEKPKNNPIESSEQKIELSGPQKRVIDSAKKELSMMFGFGLRSIEEDQELMEEINRQFLENEGYLENKKREWDVALSDVNRDAEEAENTLAKNLADGIFSFITKDSKLKNRFNN